MGTLSRCIRIREYGCRFSGLFKKLCHERIQKNESYESHGASQDGWWTESACVSGLRELEGPRPFWKVPGRSFLLPRRHCSSGVCPSCSTACWSPNHNRRKQRRDRPGSLPVLTPPPSRRSRHSGARTVLEPQSPALLCERACLPRSRGFLWVCPGFTRSPECLRLTRVGRRLFPSRPLT